MNKPVTFLTLAEQSIAEFKDKGSRFIAFAYPITHAEDIKNHIENLKEEHHKARHWCYAWRLGVDGQQFRANDDGEPAGSAGRPILGQIDSFELTDVLVVVVRYFGGTLLGVPGLIHAYKTATNMALKEADIIQKHIYRKVYLRCDYPHLSEMIRLVKLYQADIVEQKLELNCQLYIHVPLMNYQEALIAWEKTRFIEIEELSE